MERKTPIYQAHLRAGGKMVPFAGYLLPVQYSGVIAEHMAVRQTCGVFDVSHMGEILCEGRDALANLNYLMTNEFDGMYEGQARYSPMCTEEGGVVDDLIVYRQGEERYLIVVNAANKEKDFQWMKERAFGKVVFADLSDSIAQIALQGPKADQILGKLMSSDRFPKRYYSCAFDQEIQGIPCAVSKTGYTGEDGYEFYLPAGDGEKLWELLLQAGDKDGLIPCGLGARDTLRLEAGMPLYGHEMDEGISPLETGLGAFVKLGKGNFIGRDTLIQNQNPTLCRVGLRVTGRGIIREKMELYAGEKKVGVSTSGTHCPYLGHPVAMALVEREYGELGTNLEAVIRGRKVEAQVVRLPFYKK